MGTKEKQGYRSFYKMPVRCRSASTLTAVLAVTSSAALAGDASFKGLGVLDPGANPMGSLANGISSDGSKIVGFSYVYNEQTETTEGRGYVWSQDQGFFSLSSPNYTLNSASATAVSDDGNVAVGNMGFVDFTGFYELRNAVYWTGAMGENPVGTGFENGLSTNDVTPDGSFMVGATRVPDRPWPIIDQAFYFTDDDGLVTLGYLSGGTYTWGEAVSEDGSVMVGFGDWTGEGVVAFRWTEETGLQVLDGQEESAYSSAYGITPDGSVVVGGYGIGDEELFRWTEQTQFELLGRLEGFRKTWGMDVSADGAVIVGHAWTDGFYEAVIWTEEWGVRALSDVLKVEYGLDLAGWTLLFATGISNDGSTICGTGIAPDGHTEAWVATLPTGGSGGFDLTVESPCPSGGNARVSWTGASGNARVAVAFARNEGEFVIPGGPCAGTQLGLGTNGLQLVTIAQSDRNGSGSVTGRMPAGICGSFVQLVDVATCDTSNVAPIE